MHIRTPYQNKKIRRDNIKLVQQVCGTFGVCLVTGLICLAAICM